MSYSIANPRPTRRLYHSVYTKDPDAVMPYTVNWEPHLPHGDTITAATTTAYVHGSTTDVSTGITVDTTTYTAGTATTVLSGGVSNTMYDITVHVTTNAGLEDDRTLLVHVTHR